MIRDPYSILGVNRGATDAEIKKAYRRLSRQYHPDSYAGKSHMEQEMAEEKFRQIQEAYNQIVDERSGKGSSYSGAGYGGQSGYGGFAGSGASGNSRRTSTGTAEDQYLMAAMNYLCAKKYNEAVNVLLSIDEEKRGGRWNYLCAIANMGLGNNIMAQEYAERAVELEPNNLEFRQYYQQLLNGQNPNPFNGFGSFGGGYGGGYGGYGGYGNYGGNYSSCGTGSLCCDLWCLDTMCECMGGDLCGCC